MIGYWIVVAMVVVALIAVLVGGAVEPDDRPPARPRHSAGRGIVWVALGASDATGEGTPDPAADNWVSRLRSDLPAEVEVVNLGESGSTLAEARREQLPRALAASPDVVTCWLVVNDLARGVPLTAYERELAALLSELRAAWCRVVLGNVPGLSRVPALAGSPEHAAVLRLSAEHWNAAIARIAAANGAEVVDLFDEPPTDADFGPDGFHPSPAGHARLAARFRPAVERAIAAARSHEARRGR